MLVKLVTAACLVMALIVLVKRQTRAARVARLALALALPLAAVWFCLLPPDYPMILAGWHKGDLYVLEPLKQVEAKVLLMFYLNAEKWAHLNWDDPRLVVDGYCYACGEPYAPNDTFVLALLPKGVAYTKRVPGRYNHMAEPTYLSRWAVLAVLLPISLSGSVLLGLAPVLHWLRLRRGLCAYCGYDLTGNTSGRCPECGESV